ncbi:MAG: 5'-deoxynucleotidase [Christensenellales bacterium]|jgi:5'-deoxynucleotidase
MSHFFAYMSRMKYISRWGLMRNTMSENIQEHSLQAAMIAHSLAIIKNRVFGGNVNADRIAAMALYHEVGEVITGDLATPIKYFNPEIKAAYKAIEKIAEKKIFEMLPDEIKEDMRPFLVSPEQDKESWSIIKAADRICAYLKCLEELKAGNGEFEKARASILESIIALHMPEVEWWLDKFSDSFSLSLDELN